MKHFLTPSSLSLGAFPLDFTSFKSNVIFNKSLYNRSALSLNCVSARNNETCAEMFIAKRERAFWNHEKVCIENTPLSSVRKGDFHYLIPNRSVGGV